MLIPTIRPTSAYDLDMQRLALFDLDNTLVNRNTAFRAWAQEFVATHHLDATALTWLLETDARTTGTKGTFFHAVRDAFTCSKPQTNSGGNTGDACRNWSPASRKALKHSAACALPAGGSASSPTA
ncbi:hypothetical protein [Actinoplanes derwentensis]|uniref:hypothetical protein n=1 Tax=Actinoplanes derwentensis TaxID=113562 RepID=UPI000B0E5291|nr:hypothetical protein [Actinoplanes derwentensis]GID81536.1 hypothetical protein Ade03nite_04600 [Actinoplanes derwentensis]